MSFSPGGAGPKGDINVTPLVDVCLVLLIIFMVVTPMLQQGVDVLLPHGATAEKKKGDEGDLIISVKQDGSVFVGQDWIPASELRAGEDLATRSGPARIKSVSTAPLREFERSSGKNKKARPKPRFCL